MRRSLTLRLIATYLLILIIALAAQAGALMIFLTGTSQDQLREDMMSEAELLAAISPNYLTFGINEEYGSIMGDFAQRNHSVVWFVDRLGKIWEIRESTTDPLITDEAELSEDEISRYMMTALSGEPVAFENGFSSRFGQPMYSVGYPVVYGSEGHVIGAVFLHTELQTMRDMSRGITTVGLITALITAGVGLLAILWTARYITQPIQQMSVAAEKIAQGDYAQRIATTRQDEIGRLTESFNQMSANLEHQSQIQSGFVANVSHELRSPLTAMQGFAEGMLDGTIAPEEYPTYLTVVVDESRRLTKLIHELLDLSLMDAEAFALNLTVFDMNEYIRRLMITYFERFEKQGIDLDLQFKQEYCYVQADADRIRQVLVNLIDNALRYTPCGGTITLWTVLYEHRAHITVGDTGSGIAHEDLPYVFDRFYKADRAHTEKNGTGIGLSLVKSIVEKHGQTIAARSEPGRGSQFTFTLNAAEPPMDLQKSEKSDVEAPISDMEL